MPSTALDMQTGDFNGDGYADLIVLGSDGTGTVVWGSASGFTGPPRSFIRRKPARAPTPGLITAWS
jgi:hypothetical protein